MQQLKKEWGKFTYADQKKKSLKYIKDLIYLPFELVKKPKGKRDMYI